MPITVYAPNVTNLSHEISLGNKDGHINKYGRSPSGVQTTATDIWDRADNGTTQQIWLAPTAARIHAIVSASDTDGKTGSPTAAGARTVKIYGLKTWGTAESSEDVTLDGTTAVNTSNSYVIIHRMKVLTSGASGPNVGIIKATAASDATIGASILAGKGQTQMAIHGIPSTQKAHVVVFYVDFNVSASNKSCSASLLANPFPDDQPTVFLNKGTFGLASGGSSHLAHGYVPHNVFSGPCILKVQCTTTTNGADVAAGFDLILVDN